MFASNQLKTKRQVSTHPWMIPEIKNDELVNNTGDPKLFDKYFPRAVEQPHNEEHKGSSRTEVPSRIITSEGSVVPERQRRNVRFLSPDLSTLRVDSQSDNALDQLETQPNHTPESPVDVEGSATNDIPTMPPSPAGGGEGGDDVDPLRTALWDAEHHPPASSLTLDDGTRHALDEDLEPGTFMDRLEATPTRNLTSERNAPNIIPPSTTTTPANTLNAGRRGISLAIRNAKHFVPVADLTASPPDYDDDEPDDFDHVQEDSGQAASSSSSTAHIVREVNKRDGGEPIQCTEPPLPLPLPPADTLDQLKTEPVDVAIEPKSPANVEATATKDAPDSNDGDGEEGDAVDTRTALWDDTEPDSPPPSQDLSPLTLDDRTLHALDEDLISDSHSIDEVRSSDDEPEARPSDVADLEDRESVEGNAAPTSTTRTPPHNDNVNAGMRRIYSAQRPMFNLVPPSKLTASPPDYDDEGLPTSQDEFDYVEAESSSSVTADIAQEANKRDRDEPIHPPEPPPSKASDESPKTARIRLGGISRTSSARESIESKTRALEEAKKLASQRFWMPRIGLKQNSSDEEGEEK